MKTATGKDLRDLLLSIDHRGYPAYKETRGRWRYDGYTLSIDHVQGDPFATPSSVSVIVPGTSAGFPEDFYATSNRRIALQDHLLRLFERALHKTGDAGSGKSGQVATSRPGQEILERTALRISQADGSVTARFEIGFPANGRTINVRPLLQILEGLLPEVIRRTLTWKGVNQRKVLAVLNLADDQLALRSALEPAGLCAFVADGSILPRQSGISQLPMKDAVPTCSPESLAVEVELPHRGKVRGMGIKKGITLIVGGGYHGKSTLLQALERGVYDHIEGDGRELVVTDRTAVKVRAEDGRSISGTDISLFIHDLPNGKDTIRFSTEDASGSTSQAANVIEAVEAGTRVLLMDEDTSATNFMVRDALMARVVSKEKEPITPFISRMRGMKEQAGISTVLVAGSSGAFFHVADTVIQMDQYRPVEITEKAKAAAAGTEGMQEKEAFSLPDFVRVPTANEALRREDRIKTKVLSEDNFLLSRDEVWLRGLEQIADREQTAALALILKYLQLHILDGRKTVREAVREMESVISQSGLEALYDGQTVSNGLACVRPQEIFGTLNRYRKLEVRK